MELCVGFDFYRIFCHKELPDCSLFYDVTTDKEQSVENTTLEFIAPKLKQWSIQSNLSVILLRSLRCKSECLNEGWCQPVFHQDSVRWLPSVIWRLPSVEWKSYHTCLFAGLNFYCKLAVCVDWMWSMDNWLSCLLSHSSPQKPLCRQIVGYILWYCKRMSVSCYKLLS